HGEVAALRDALRDGLSISSAVSRARESLRSDTHILVGALASFELERADGAMEAALAMRPVVRALELFAGRTGIRVTSIPVANHAGVADLLTALRPGAVIIAGRHAGDEAIARFAYAVRSAGGALPLALFQRGDVAVSRTSSVHVLPGSPSEATAQALALLDGHAEPVRLSSRSRS